MTRMATKSMKQGQDRQTRQDKTGPVRTRHDRAGKDRTGQNRTDKDLTQQSRTGQNMTLYCDLHESWTSSILIIGILFKDFLALI